MSVNQRINLLIKSLHIQQKDFANTIGIPNTTLSNILHTSTQPSFPILYKILKAYPNLRVHWLMLGEGEIFNTELSSTSTIQEPIEPYNKPADTEGVGMKIDLIETERQLYERIIATKDELIAYLKKEIERHEAEKRGDSTV